MIISNGGSMTLSLCERDATIRASSNMVTVATTKLPNGFYRKIYRLVTGKRWEEIRIRIRDNGSARAITWGGQWTK